MFKFKQYSLIYTFLVAFTAFLVPLYVFFPFKFFTSNVLGQYDFPFHFINTLNGIEYFNQHFRFWGYNPFFAAGMEESLVPSGQLIATIMAPLTIFGNEVAFNLTTIIMCALVPLTMMWSTKLLGGDKSRQYLSLFITSAFLCGSNIGQEFVFIGHLGFIVSAAFTILSYACLEQYFSAPRKKVLILYGISTALAIWTHVLAIIIVALVSISCISTHIKRAHSKTTIHALYALLLAILINSWWLLRFSLYFILAHPHGQMSQYLQSNTENTTLYLSNPFILAAVISYLVFIKYNKVKVIGGLTLIISLFGSQLGLFDSQPTRFFIPFFLFTALIGIQFQYSKYKRSYIVLLAIITFTSLYQAQTNTFTSFNIKQSESISNLFKFIRKNISPETRIHIQNSIRVPYFNSRITSLVPRETNIPTLADTYHFPYTFPSFVAHKIFGRNIFDISNNELQYYVNLYNIGHFMIFDTKVKKYFSKIKNYQRIYSREGIEIFKTNIKPNYCLNCHAQISFEHDKISIKNIKQDQIILKFHYSDSLATIPSDVTISEVYLGDDPRPFIKIKNINNHQSVDIINIGKWHGL